MEEWRIIDTVDPIGFARLEMIAGIIANAVYASGKLPDCMRLETEYPLEFERKRVMPEKPVDEEELKEQGKRFARAFGGVVTDGG